MNIGQKQKRYAKPTHLKFVASHPCCMCGSGHAVVAHHFSKKRGGGGIGMKPLDYYSVPLCGKCHGAVHSEPGVAKQHENAFAWEALKLCVMALRLTENEK